MISVTLVGDRAVIAQLQGIPRGLQDVLTRRLWAIALKLKARVQQKLSGEVLRVVTGALRRSIEADVQTTRDMVMGRVYSTGDVKYARIHEFGGRTPAHVIEPRNAQALSFMMGGTRVFAKRVNHPGSQMPERSFLRSSMREMRPDIIREISQGLLEAAAGGRAGA